MNVILKKTNLGIGLLELMLSLAIIALLLVMATRYYEITHVGEQVTSAISMIEGLHGAAAQWQVGRTNGYTDITYDQLQKYELLPKYVNGDGIGVNPWGGSLEIHANPANNALLDIVMSDVTQGGCAGIVGKLAGQARMIAPASPDSCVAGAQAITVTYG